MKPGMINDDVEQERLSHLLRELAAHDERTEPPAHVQRRVMSRWEAWSAAGGSAFTAPPRRPARWSGWTPARVSFGVAGATATILLVGWMGSRSTEQAWRAGPPTREAITVVPLEPIQPVAVDAAPRRTAPARQPYDPERSDVAPAGAAVTLATADVEPFVRLLPMTEEEMGTIRLARVRLRGQAARTLGLDSRMPLPGADGFVEADVLLGEDGLARAIRFVR